MSEIVTVVPPTEIGREQAVLGMLVPVHARDIAGLPAASVNLSVGAGDTVTVVLPRVAWIDTVIVIAASAAPGAASMRRARIHNETVFICHSFCEP
jgi:hypothetical protein